MVDRYGQLDLFDGEYAAKPSAVSAGALAPYAYPPYAPEHFSFEREVMGFNGPLGGVYNGYSDSSWLTSDEEPLDPAAVQRELGGEDLRRFGVDPMLLETAGRVVVVDVDMEELTCAFYCDERPAVVARLLRLLLAPADERFRAADALAEATRKNDEINEIIEQVAGSERKEAFAEMYPSRFGTGPKTPDEEMIEELTSVHTWALDAYIARLREAR